VEAGLRSGRKWEPFPEEINRHLISRVSDLHFAPTEKSKAALQKENVDSKSIFVTGNTVVDAFQWIVSKEKSAQAREIIKSARERKIVLITVHRRENVENNVDLYFRTLARLIKGHPDLYFVYPVHPRPIFGELVGKYLSGLENLTALPPVDYATMVALLDACHLAVTDSGGIQEEVMCAGKPVLILRDVTERPEVLESGNGILIGNRMDQLQGLFDDLVNPNSARYAHMSRKSGLLGDGRASERIVDAIDTFLS
jgi:UDP-N-acetylglucosamine 2-epimerase (non-hydrolysing)